MLSGALYFLRGLSAQVGIGRPMAAPLRYLSYSVDTVLPTAALTLIAVLPSAVFANGRLVEILSLVIVYVWLGSYALKRGRTPRTRLICFLFALLSYASIVAMARAHHPLGPFWRLAR